MVIIATTASASLGVPAVLHFDLRDLCERTKPSKRRKKLACYSLHDESIYPYSNIHGGIEKLRQCGVASLSAGSLL